MKLKLGLRLVGICGTLFAGAFAQNAREISEPPVSSPTPQVGTSSVEASAPALSRAEALKLIIAARRYVAHPSPAPPRGAVSEPKVTTPDFDLPTPPPAARAETRPQAPGPDYVWVAGHYMPVKGEWRWVNGEWAVPATPISVWIPARYDSKEMKWAPGYWQPDVATPAPPEPPTKNGAPTTPVPRY